MAKLTLYPRFDLGTLAAASPGAEATTKTGWTVGTNTPTKYKSMEVGVERSASGWTATVLPNTDPIATFDVLISTEALTGKFAAEAWALALKVIAVTAGGDQDGAARVRLWKTKDKSTFTALTAALDLSAVTNLATGASQTTSGNLEPGAIELEGEYLALQIVWKITGAGAGSTRDVLFREGEGITLVTADFTESGKPPTATTEAASAITQAEATLNGKVNPKGQATSYWFEYGTTEGLGSKTSEGSAGEGESDVAKSKALSGLEPGTKYFFRLVAESAAGKTNGTILSFTTQSSPDVVSRWELDETSGTTANDSVGTNDGTYTAVEVGQGSIIPASPESHSARIAGEGSYISVPDSESLRFKLGLTLKLWYEWTGDTGILAAREDNWELALEEGGVLRFAFRDPAGEWHEVASTEEALPEGKHRIDVTYNRSDLLIFIDGVEVASAEFSQEIRGSEGDLWIGVQPGGEFQRCNGRYQRVEIRSGARSVAEILAEYEEEAVEVWVDFTGDFETGDFSQYLETQAPEGRATVVKSPVAEGEYAGHFEVQEGDPEVAAGHRSEAIPDKEFRAGDALHFRDLINLQQVDWGHWTIIAQWHDTSKGSPPLCAMLIETGEGKRLRIQTGDSKSIYFDLPVPAEKAWFELVVHVVFEAEGSVEVWINGASQGKVTGIDPLGTEPTNFKLGIYRSGESVGTTEVLHDGVKITEKFFSKPPGEAEPKPHSRIAVTREHVPDRLAVRIADSSTGASIARWAEDEAKAENVVGNLRKTGEMPGGHKEMTCSLPRDPRVDWPDLDTYVDAFVEGAGGEKVWEGRIDKKPKTDGERLLIEPAAVGHQAALQDRKALSLGFIDGDLSKWGEPSAQRRLNLIAAGIRLMAATSVGHSSADPESVLASIINDFTNVETVATDTEAGEAHYYSGGPDIGEILYAALGDIAKGEASASWESNIAVGTTDTFTTATTGTDHDTSAASSQTVTAPGTGYKYARIRNRLNAVSEGLALKRIFAWQPRVIGNHDLTLQGTWPNVGFTSGQMLRLAIPLYTYLEANEESVEDEGYVIPQAWFADHGAMAQVVQELTKYELLDYFVLHGKLFEQRVPGTYGRRWQAYSGPSELQQTGEDGSRLWDRIVGRYQDVDGRAYTVGWPGSGADVESAALQITDPDHPAVKADKVREDLLDLKGISTAERALEACERWLKDANELPRSGEATLRGYVMDDKGIYRPASQVQPGDWIRFPDDSDRDYRKIVQPDYTDPSKECRVTLDAPSEALQALLERMNAALSPLGF